VGVEEAAEVVDLVGGQSGDAVRQVGDRVAAVEGLMLDVEGGRADDQAAQGGAGQAAFVVLGGVCGPGGDLGVEQGVALTVRGSDGDGGLGDAELWCGQPEPGPEVVDAGEPVERGGQQVKDAGCLCGLAGKVESCGGLLEDGGAGLHDA